MITLKDPCTTCIVGPICKEHKTCETFQKLKWKSRLCKHNYKISRMLMRLPTGLMYKCSKCGHLK